MNGMMVPSVSAGSSQRAARETCAPHVTLPSGAAQSGAARARSRSASTRTLLTAWLESERRCRSEEHTSELQSLAYLVCRLLLEKKKKKIDDIALDVRALYLICRTS